ncbi:TPA: DUF551 domain-containing protein [Escherichia coli]|nr:DUF551 domain-containing protein [Escherichia coli]HCO6121838.1 DUF551 domain-containing protein [Escherichia coli]HCO6503379.1 DUF551 domain-containing protein [Escherichia coli]HCO6634809.1 DUF551 domain-containing protein [Escherichia coli]HCO6996756.1 DUF551 domain-containing protein [Escherichia coli]
MAEFTKEQLIEKLERRLAVTTHYPDFEEAQLDAQIFKIALEALTAGMEQEPVAWLLSGGGAKNNVSFDSGNAYADPLREVTPLYTAPPAPVSVPAAMEIDDDFDSAFEHGKAVGWNAYRAAMFQSGNFRENKNSSTNNFREIAETSTNYPVIPSEVLSAIKKVAKIRADFDDFDGDRRGIGDCLDEAEQELIVTINKYASQLAAEPIAPNDVREQTAIPQVPVTPDGWISCSERMPEDTKMLLAFSQGQIVAAYWNWVMSPIDYKKYRAFTYLSGNILDDVTHWMPLPEPPEQDGE